MKKFIKLIMHLLMHLMLLVPSFIFIMTLIVLLIPESSGFFPCCDGYPPHLSDYLPALEGSFLGGFPIYPDWEVNLVWYSLLVVVFLLPFVFFKLIHFVKKLKS